MMEPWNCCRICLLVDSLNPIFSIPSESEKYTEILLKTTGIKIELNDAYPQEMCVQCINFINQCIKFRLLAKSTQKSLTERSNNQNTFNLKAELTEDRKFASIDISEYLGHSISGTCEVNYNVHIEKVETSDDNTENLMVFVSDIQDIPEKSIEFTFDTKTSRKRVKHTKGSKTKQPTRKRATRKNNNLGNNQPTRNKNSEEIATNEDNEGGTNTVRQDTKTRAKETIECEYCHKILTSKLSLRNHYKIHTGFDVVCEHCGKKFITRRLLLMHCRAKHGYEKTDKCSYCEYTASNAEQVKIHERLHTGEKPYACQECGAGFHRKSSYLQHVAIHLPEKTVQCEQCPALFKSVTLMRIHASRHKRPSYQYRCRVCAGAFARKRNVVRHLQRIHAVAGAGAHVERVKIA